jgi:hypothetical protein
LNLESSVGVGIDKNNTFSAENNLEINNNNIDIDIDNKKTLNICRKYENEIAVMILSKISDYFLGLFCGFRLLQENIQQYVLLIIIYYILFFIFILIINYYFYFYFFIYIYFYFRFHLDLLTNISK